MENYSIHLPSYSIGSKVYDKIPEICEPYGTKVIAIGGHKAINAAKDKIVKACEKSFSTAGRYDFYNWWRKIYRYRKVPWN